MKYKQFIFVTIFLGCLICPEFYGQASKLMEAHKPTGCEENEARLDKIALSFSSKPDLDHVLIIIARLGDGESSSVINRHRLHNAKEYILSRMPSIQRDRIIVAQGEEITGFGRVEFYSNGTRIDYLLVGKNQSLCVDCCENNRIPPFKDREKKKKIH